MSWLRIRETVRKEFIQLFRDKRNRPILVMAPLIQLLVFGYAVRMDVRDLPMAVFDQCRTRSSRELVQKLEGKGYLSAIAYQPSPELAEFEDGGEPEEEI